MSKKSGSIFENSVNVVEQKSVHPNYQNIPNTHQRSRHVIVKLIQFQFYLSPNLNRLTRVPFTSTKPPPPPKESLDEADLLPEETANIFNIITFGWITELMSLGYRRPLEATDLYRLSSQREAAYIADKINASFDRRQKTAGEYNKRLASGEVPTGLWRNIIWTLKGNRKEREKKWREVDGRKRASLTWAMNDSVKWWFWSGGLLKVVGDTAQVTSPLVVKVCLYLCLCRIHLIFVYRL